MLVDSQVHGVGAVDRQEFVPVEAMAFMVHPGAMTPPTIRAQVSLPLPAGDRLVGALRLVNLRELEVVLI